jgi:alkaline phosphatase
MRRRAAEGPVLGAAIMLLIAGAQGVCQPAARNVIVMIPDGCGISVATLARWYSGRPLALDPMLCGGVRTHAANSLITCSAAAATAFATGFKTDIGVLAMGPGSRRPVVPSQPESLRHRPLVTLLEAARLEGKSVGLVATSTVTHATPAAFAAHVPAREMHDEVMQQMVHQDLDVVFGGGMGWLVPAGHGGRRKDDLDLKHVLERRGCRLVRNAEELALVSSTPVWGLFAEEHMCPDADRSRHAPGEPSLAQMTLRAIELLSADPDGFFLMVEGSRIDWAGHANDPFYMVTDFLAFDSAVRVAVDFAARDHHTLILAFPDHNCGGLSIGSATSTAETTSTADLLGPLRRMKLTSTGLVREMGSDRSPANIREQVRQWWGVTLADSELAFINCRRQQGTDLEYALSEVFSRNHTILGWTTHSHTGEDVPLWAYGPGRPTSGVMDNTDIARAVAAAVGLDMAAAARKLFADLGKPASDSRLRLDSSHLRKPVLAMGRFRMPIGTDLLIDGSDTTRLSGITVYSPGNGHAYGPAAIRDRAQRAEPSTSVPEGPRR